MGTGITSRTERLHQEIIDMLLVNPHLTSTEIAAHVGRHRLTVTAVMNSDLFKAAYAARRSELVEPIVAQTFKEQVQVVASLGLEVLMQKLQQPHQRVKDRTAVDAVKLGMTAHGLEAPKGQVTIDLGKIAEALRGGSPSQPSTRDMGFVVEAK